MENHKETDFRFSSFSSPLKWAITAYLMLAAVAFGFAAFQSYERYQLSHEKAAQYYRGDPAEGELAMAKPLGHLVSVTHVHSFTMPLVFLTVWLGLQGVQVSFLRKKIIIIGGAFSICLYNFAPYLVRYRGGEWAVLFTIGGVGLFLFFLWPAATIFRKIWSS